jgi:cytochrome P450
MTDPTVLANPHPTYAEWREEGPIRRVRLAGGEEAWVVTRHREARAALTDSRLSKAPRDPDSFTEAARAINTHMLATDPPDHTRLRKLVTAAFTTRRIEAMRPLIEAITDDLLDRIAEHDEVDLVDTFAFPLPVRVICELLGIPAKDRDRFRHWSAAIVAGADATGRATAESLQVTLGQLVAYLRELIAERRAHPGDDLLSALVTARDSGDRLTDDELTSMGFLLLVAGHETTTNLLSAGVHLLLDDRDRWDRLRAEPALLPGAVEEFLRLEGTVNMATGRYALADLELGGETIKEGDLVMVGLLCAGRDRDQFPDPDELRFDRAANQHLAFGHGIHHCLGAPLARLEARIAFGKLLTRFPDLRLAAPADEPDWRHGTLLRGLRTLPVRPHG